MTVLTEAEKKTLFIAHYKEVMPSILDKTQEQAANQASLFTRIGLVNTNAAVLNILIDNLDIYIDNSKAKSIYVTQAKRLRNTITKHLAIIATRRSSDTQIN